MAATEIVVGSLDEQERVALASLVAIFGDDTDTILNALHVLAAKVAIMTGVKPERFAAIMKEHWDAMATRINTQVH